MGTVKGCFNFSGLFLLRSLAVAVIADIQGFGIAVHIKIGVTVTGVTVTVHFILQSIQLMHCHRNSTVILSP